MLRMKTQKLFQFSQNRLFFINISFLLSGCEVHLHFEFQFIKFSLRHNFDVFFCSRDLWCSALLLADWCGFWLNMRGFWSWCWRGWSRFIELWTFRLRLFVFFPAFKFLCLLDCFFFCFCSGLMQRHLHSTASFKYHSKFIEKPS